MSRMTVGAPASTDDYVRAMADLIIEHFQPERIILFGSQARGETDRDSDVDLLVVMAGGVDRRETAAQIRRALRDIPVAKDIVVSWSEEIARRGHVIGTVLRPALREGKVMYERSWGGGRGSALAPFRAGGSGGSSAHHAPGGDRSTRGLLPSAAVGRQSPHSLLARRPPAS